MAAQQQIRLKQLAGQQIGVNIFPRLKPEDFQEV